MVDYVVECYRMIHQMAARDSSCNVYLFVFFVLTAAVLSCIVQLCWYAVKNLLTYSAQK